MLPFISYAHKPCEENIRLSYTSASGKLCLCQYRDA
jgi:hypothetical protein